MPGFTTSAPSDYNSGARNEPPCFGLPPFSELTYYAEVMGLQSESRVNQGKGDAVRHLSTYYSPAHSAGGGNDLPTGRSCCFGRVF